jgi:hypothetical protein
MESEFAETVKFFPETSEPLIATGILVGLKVYPSLEGVIE